MGIIHVPCANQECDSEDITLVVSHVLLNGFKHDFSCDICNTTFSVLTSLDSVKIPKGVN